MNATFALSGIWYAVRLAEVWIFLAFAVVCLVVALIALFKCLPKNSQRFDIAFKRTKGFWLGMTGGASALCLIGAYSQLFGGPFGFLFPVIGACMAAVYLADVEPAVSE